MKNILRVVQIIGFFAVASFTLHQKYVPIWTDILAAFFITAALFGIIALVKWG